MSAETRDRKLRLQSRFSLRILVTAWLTKLSVETIYQVIVIMIAGDSEDRAARLAIVNPALIFKIIESPVKRRLEPRRKARVIGDVVGRVSSNKEEFASRQHICP